VFGIVVHEIDSVLESGRSNIMEEASESLDFVVGEVPDDEGDADAVLEDGVEAGEVVESVVVDIDHADGTEALHLGSGDIFEQPGWEVGREDAEVFADFGGEGFEAALFAGENVDRTVAAAEKPRMARLGERGGSWRGGSNGDS